MRRTKTQASTSVALAWNIFDADDFDVPLITITTAAIVTPEDLTVTLDSHLGAGSDAVLLTIPGADLVGATSIVIKGIAGMVNGDKILVSQANTGTVAMVGSATTELTDRTLDKEPLQNIPFQYWINGVEQTKADMTGGRANYPLINTITFANDTTPVNLFAVTGDVVVKIFAICSTNCASAGACNVELGITGSVAAMIASTDVTTIAAGEIWHDNASDSDIEAASVAKEFVIGQTTTILLTLSAQTDSGVISFYCDWYPLSADGNVTVS